MAKGAAGQLELIVAPAFSSFGGSAAFFLLMQHPRQVLNATGVRRALERIAHEVAERNENGNLVTIVGIQRGGVHLASRLQEVLQRIWNHPVPLGFVDVSMHLDDHSERLPQNIQPTSVPFDPTGKIIVLVDDVLFSGRTVRAALDALTDLGRPKAIQLAVLIDRGNRELPIKADFVGKEVPTGLEERVEVSLRENGAKEDAVSLMKP